MQTLLKGCNFWLVNPWPGFICEGCIMLLEMYSRLYGSVKLTPQQLTSHNKNKRKKYSKVIRKKQCNANQKHLAHDQMKAGQDFSGHLRLAFHALLGCGVGQHYSSFPLV